MQITAQTQLIQLTRLLTKLTTAHQIRLLTRQTILLTTLLTVIDSFSS